MKRWESLRVGEGIPTDPAKRVEYLLASTQDVPDRGDTALLMVVIHARTALRCRRAVLDALADRTDPDSSLRVIGEASMASVALYLAARSAQLYCDEYKEPGPLGRRKLDGLVLTAEHMRDCVMHWDGKARAASPAFLNATDRDVLVIGSDRGRSTYAGITWQLFESYVDRLRRWAEFMLDRGAHPADARDGDLVP